MAITQAYEIDGVTISTTEISIVSGTSTVNATVETGVYQLWVDGGNMAKGDEFKIIISEIVEATGGTRKTVFAATLSDVQSEIFVTPMLVLMFGWNMTLTKVAGTDRAFDASIRRVA